MLHPGASSPPSAKKSACTTRTAGDGEEGGMGPSRSSAGALPPRWPLDPVPGC